MKFWLTILLAALTAAGSVTSATDTLTLRSYRLINACSGEQRWLVSASIGEVFDSDSLMSFDITIGFDTSLLRPTDGLFSGTLAEQMKFGDISPGINLRVPGEIRVSAFTITRNVRGNLPLFAVAGDYLGNCGSVDSLTLPWNPEYNEEFKKWTKVFVSTHVESRAIPLESPTQGISTLPHTLTLLPTDTLGTITAIVTVPENNGKPLSGVFSLKNGRGISIVNITSTATNPSVSISNDSTSAQIDFTASERTDTIWLEIKARPSANQIIDTVTSSIVVRDTCSCSRPMLTGKTEILVDSISVSNVMALNEDPSTTITINQNEVNVKAVHGDPLTIVVSDLLGRTLYSGNYRNQNLINIPTTDFNTGLYMISIMSGKTVKTQLFQR